MGVTLKGQTEAAGDTITRPQEKKRKEDKTMGYFLFTPTSAENGGLIVGGGTVALRKAEKLLPFSLCSPLAAPKILPELVALPG